MLKTDAFIFASARALLRTENLAASSLSFEKAFTTRIPDKMSERSES